MVLRDAATGEPFTAPRKASGTPLQVVFSPDGRRIAVYSRNFFGGPQPEGTTHPRRTPIEVWDAATLETISTPDDLGSFDPRSQFDSGRSDMQFNADGSLLFVFAYKNTTVFDALKGTRLSRISVHDSGAQVLFSPDGGRILIADREGVAHLQRADGRAADPSDAARRPADQRRL